MEAPGCKNPCHASVQDRSSPACQRMGRAAAQWASKDRNRPTRQSPVGHTANDMLYLNATLLLLHRMPPSPPRLASVDQLRGTVMLLMLLDHVRETFFLQHQVATRWTRRRSPLRCSPAVCWRTCAPVLTGLLAWLYGQPGGSAPGHRSLPAQARAVPGRAGTYPGELRLDLPAAAGHAVPAGDLGHRAEHDRAGRAALAATPGTAGAGNRGGGRHNLFDGLRVQGNGLLAVLWKVLHQRDWIEAALRLRTSIRCCRGSVALGYLMGPWFGRERAPEQRLLGRHRWPCSHCCGSPTRMGCTVAVPDHHAAHLAEHPQHHQVPAVIAVPAADPGRGPAVAAPVRMVALARCARWPISAPRRCSSTCCTCVLKGLYLAALAIWGPDAR